MHSFSGKWFKNNKGTAVTFEVVRKVFAPVARFPLLESMFSLGSRDSWSVKSRGQRIAQEIIRNSVLFKIAAHRGNCISIVQVSSKAIFSIN